MNCKGLDERGSMYNDGIFWIQSAQGYTRCTRVLQGMQGYRGCIRIYQVYNRVYRVYKGMQGVEDVVITYLGTIHGGLHEVLTQHCMWQNHKPL